MLISKELMLIIVTAIVFAAPISYAIMNSWLQNFAYRIDMEWTVFLAASVSLLLLALGTVSYQALKAAFANPVDALRNE
jgi:putative ABC transport system permease protein